MRGIASHVAGGWLRVLSVLCPMRPAWVPTIANISKSILTLCWYHFAGNTPTLHCCKRKMNSSLYWCKTCKIFDVFMLQLCCCITSDQEAFLTCYLLCHIFIFCIFPLIEQGTFCLPSSKMLKQVLNLWVFPWNCCSWHFYIAGRLFNGKFLSSWGRGRVLWAMWETTALSRGPEISGGWDLLMRVKSYLYCFCMKDADSPSTKFRRNSWMSRRNPSGGSAFVPLLSEYTQENLPLAYGTSVVFLPATC